MAAEGPDRGLRRPARRRGRDRRGRDRGDPRARPSGPVMEAVEFADNSPEPPLESLYDHLYVVGDQVPGWYAVDERTPEPHRGEEEREAAEQRARREARRGAARPTPGSRTARPPAGRPGEDELTPTATAADALEDGMRRGRGATVAVMRMREALRDAMAEEMRRDESVFVMGEDVGRLPGRLQGHRGAAGRVRREAGPRHADLRELDRRDGRRRGDGGAAPGRRADDRQLRAAGDRPDRSTTWRRSPTCSTARFGCRW